MKILKCLDGLMWCHTDIIIWPYLMSPWGDQSNMNPWRTHVGMRQEFEKMRSNVESRSPLPQVFDSIPNSSSSKTPFKFWEWTFSTEQYAQIWQDPTRQLSPILWKCEHQRWSESCHLCVVATTIVNIQELRSCTFHNRLYPSSLLCRVTSLGILYPRTISHSLVHPTPKHT